MLRRRGVMFTLAPATRPTCGNSVGAVSAPTTTVERSPFQESASAVAASAVSSEAGVSPLPPILIYR